MIQQALTHITNQMDVNVRDTQGAACSDYVRNRLDSELKRQKLRNGTSLDDTTMSQVHEYVKERMKA